MPEVRMDRDGQSYAPKRTRVYKTLQLRNRRSFSTGGKPQELGLDTLFISPTGEINLKKLDELLKNDCSDLDQILKGQFTYKRTALAYYLFQLLQTHSLEELIKEEKKDKKELLLQIAQTGAVFMSEPANLFSLIDAWGTRKSLLGNFQRRARPFLFSLLLYAAAGPLFSAGEYAASYIGGAMESAAKSTKSALTFSSDGKEIIGSNGSGGGRIGNNGNTGGGIQIAAGAGADSINVGMDPLEASDLHRSSFPPGVNHSIQNFKLLNRVSAGLDWKITGNIRQSGYWAVATSHQLNSEGAWVINKDVKEIQSDFPQEFKDSAPRLTLEKRIRVNENTTATRIPIRDGSRLAAIAVTDALDPQKLMRHSVTFFTDGTAQLNIFKDNNARLADLTITLIEDSASPEVHATVPLLPLDQSKLFYYLEQKLANIKNFTRRYSRSGELYQQQTSNLVFNHHLYSLDPHGQDGDLKFAKTAEELVNAVAEMAVCTCDTCNLEAVLLNSTNPDPRFATNFAMGYLQNILPGDHTPSSFLKRDTYHAFGIGMNGEIVDATPSMLANDALTLDFVGLLNQQGQFDSDFIKTWEKIMSETANEEWKRKLVDIHG